MNRFPIAVLPVILATVLSLPLNSRASDLRSGDRVRVFTSGEQGTPVMLTGTVVSMDHETLVVQIGRTKGNVRTGEPATLETTMIPLNTITGVDRFLGRETHEETGAIVGAASGMAVGLIVWIVGSTSVEPTNTFGRTTAQTTAPTYVLVGGLIGAGVGTLIGHQTGDERWGRVEGFSVGVSPTGNNTASASLSINFSI